MKLQILFIISLIFPVGACHYKDKKFCACMNKGQELNSLSEKIWLETGTRKDSMMMKKLIAVKNKLCVDYQYKNGEELMRLREDCK